MARITHVKKAQQRYKTVPVLDDEGNPKRTPVMRKDGTQKTTKRGAPVFMTVTVADKNQPLPPYTCDSCGKEIAIGSPMKHISPKSGPYDGRKLTRHEDCPTWQIWEYSSSWSARIAQAVSDFNLDGVESVDDVQSALDDVASNIKELAEESREAASNMEEGFGHPTSQSEEAEQRGDDLDNWADEITQVDIPDLPEPEERYFITNGDGVPSDLFETDGYDTEMDAMHALESQRDDDDPDRDSSVEPDDGFEVEAITPEEPSEEQLDEWRDEVRDACSIVDESPV